MESLSRTIPAFQQNTTLLAVGGCHTHGWPIGDANSFAALTAQRLNAKVYTLGTITLHSSSLVADYVRNVGPPAVLLLQLGHHESSEFVLEHFMRFFSRRPRMEPPPSAPRPRRHRTVFTANMLPAYNVFHPSTEWQWRDRLKLLFHEAAGLMGSPVLDDHDYSRRYRSLLEELTTLSIPRIICMGPFPSPIRAFKKPRDLISQITKQEAARSGIDFLDSKAILLEAMRKKPVAYSIFADCAHLNRYGHDALSDALVELLLRE